MKAYGILLIFVALVCSGCELIGPSRSSLTDTWVASWRYFEKMDASGTHSYKSRRELDLRPDFTFSWDVVVMDSVSGAFVGYSSVDEGPYRLQGKELHFLHERLASHDWSTGPPPPDKKKLKPATIYFEEVVYDFQVSGDTLRLDLHCPPRATCEGRPIYYRRKSRD